ncbi:MAG TPA: hypothetical protein ENN43_03115 [bacterium]|nr:hypothetical protein [bacterium]
MNKKTIIIVLLAVAVAGAVFLAVNSRNAGSGQMYICPMHPQVVQDRPGSCPICGMDLVPMEQDSKESMEGHEGHGDVSGSAGAKTDKDRETVYVSPYKQQLINIRLGSAEVRQLETVITAPGVVAYDPELYSAQLDYITAYKSGDKYAETGGIAQKLKEAAGQKLRSLGLSAADIRALEKKDGPDRSLIMEDPAGNVTVYAQVYQEDIGLIRAGAAAEITASTAGGGVFYGAVTAVDNVLNRETRSSRVRITAGNRDNVLRPEMFVNVKIRAAKGVYLSVPEEAVIDTGVKSIVFISGENGHFEPREIVRGEKMGEYYAVKKGLKGGEVVVVNGNFLVDSESRLKAAISNMAAHTH